MSNQQRHPDETDADAAAPDVHEPTQELIEDIEGQQAGEAAPGEGLDLSTFDSQP
ncbi:MAG: hypothetical protein HY329_26480 [Chloroflexi bacterium]|nr:hypothetical protein [Chloroflexota bacterium]